MKAVWQHNLFNSEDWLRLCLTQNWPKLGFASEPVEYGRAFCLGHHRAKTLQEISSEEWNLGQKKSHEKCCCGKSLTSSKSEVADRPFLGLGHIQNQNCWSRSKISKIQIFLPSQLPSYLPASNEFNAEFKYHLWNVIDLADNSRGAECHLFFSFFFFCHGMGSLTNKNCFTNMYLISPSLCWGITDKDPLVSARKQSYLLLLYLSCRPLSGLWYEDT